jgi:hypothetical protein
MLFQTPFLCHFHSLNFFSSQSIIPALERALREADVLLSPFFNPRLTHSPLHPALQPPLPHCKPFYLQTILPALERALKEADFVAIDCEFTGLNDGLSQEEPLDDLAERYEKVRASFCRFKKKKLIKLCG